MARKYQNMETQRLHDRNESEKKSSPRPSAKEAPDEQDGEEQEQPMEDVVAEHGPAQEVEVSSKHEDGHVHKSKHHDAKSASDHVHKAFGEEPPMGETDSAMGSGAMGAPSIPTMAG